MATEQSAQRRRRVASILNADRDDAADLRSSASAWEGKAVRSWLEEEMARRRADYSQQEDIRVWCGTYNVNDKTPKDASEIKDWVQGCGDAELLVFSFQEFDLSADAMFRYTPYREDAWRAAIERALESGDGGRQYVKVHSRQLVGGLIMIYARSDIQYNVSAVSSASLATGLMGVMANKGAVAVRLQYLDTPLTFVNSHLAAFVPNSAERNAQFRSTTSLLLFPPSSDGLDGQDSWSTCLRPAEPRPVGNGKTVWDCEALIWMGDLNYRLDAPRDDLDALVRHRDYSGLLAYDQLALQQQLELAFEGFKEGRIDFAPTFKFDAGSDNYDTSEKQRDPAYTDRIIYLASSRCPLTVERYSSHPAVRLSDHKPVSATLRLPVYRVAREQRERIAEELVSTYLDPHLAEEELEPAEVELVPGPELNFPGIEYGTAATGLLDLCNDGEASATATPWAFVPRPDSHAALPAWLTVSPCSGVLKAKTRQTLSFTGRIDSRLAGSLSFPPQGPAENALAVSELLVLSARGRDLFLSVSVTSSVPTVVGSALNHLVQLKKPIRETTLAERSAIAGSTSGPDPLDSRPSTTETVPLVIRRLVTFLAENGLGVAGLFQQEAEEATIRDLLRCLDTGAHFPSAASSSEPLQKDAAADAAAAASDEEVQHLVDAVDLLDHLEADLGSVSLGPVLCDESYPAASPAEHSSVPAPVGFRRGASKAAPPRDAPTVHAAANCLLRLLEALPEPLVEYRLYEAAIRCESREAAYEVLHSLSEVHANTLLYLIAFLRIVLRQWRTSSATDGAYLHLRLALTFSQVLLRAPPPPPPSREAESSEPGHYAPEGIDPGSVPRRAKQFVAFLLQEEEETA
ncbi:hypothetical protein JCM3774_005041 [Rhodotorula dairenensis]